MKNHDRGMTAFQKQKESIILYVASAGERNESPSVIRPTRVCKE